MEGSWLFRHFTKESGLQDDEFNTGAYAKLSNGDLAFGGVNGVNIFNPATVLQSGFTPNVFITGILTGNDVVLPNDKTGILQQFPQINLSEQKVGVWSRTVKLSDKVKDGERIEIYRPLIADPKDLRRRRAEKAKEEGRADKITGGRPQH